jgi:pimeloyl-ACP methyl ester carboxylesterase
MNIKIPLLFMMLSSSVFAQNIDDLSEFYSIPSLRNHLHMRRSLRKAGFRSITFKTSDDFSIAGFFLSRPHATCNIIICAGFFPGKKEGMATFYALLPHNCNILLFDARGRGQSDGLLLWKLWRYGMDEYKDILGAIDWVNNDNELPIVVGGTCSGVFHAAHAVIYLEKTKKLQQLRVKGLFFDSGWGSVSTMSKSSAIANIKKRLAKFMSILYGTKKNIKQNRLYQACSYALLTGFYIGHTVCALPITTYYEKTTNLFDKIHLISIPVLFIHSYDDTHADIEEAIKLSELTPNKQSWWIEKSSHAKHHLIHKDIYKKKLETFITTVTN